MEKLSPREIQDRIRAGESLEDMIRAGGERDYLEPFAIPVIAERRHMAEVAGTHYVRRRSETTSHRTLATTVASTIGEASANSLHWDAWRNPDRTWTISISFSTPERTGQAIFAYDSRACVSVAVNDDARWLIGDGPVLLADPDTEPTIDVTSRLKKPAAEPLDVGTDEPEAFDDYAETYDDSVLEEVNGVYDIVSEASPQLSDLDVLYDILDSHRGDSDRFDPEATEDASTALTLPVRHEAHTQRREAGNGASSKAESAEKFEQDALVDFPGGGIRGLPQPPHPTSSGKRVPGSDTDGQEGEKLNSPVGSSDKPRQGRKHKKRAEVPSWDDIVFGSPRAHDIDDLM